MKFRNPLLRYIRSMEKELGPLIYHDHRATGWRGDCPACKAGHPFAPHYDSCGCGHCPDPETARAAVIKDLKQHGQAELSNLQCELLRWT